MEIPNEIRFHMQISHRTDHLDLSPHKSLSLNQDACFRLPLSSLQLRGKSEEHNDSN